MATQPNFASTLRAGVAALTTGVTARDGTGSITDIITGVAAGTEVTSIVVQATGDLADSVVNLFLHNGTSWFHFEGYDVGDPAAGSTSLTAYRLRTAYVDLWLPSASWKLGATITVTPTAGSVNVFAFGADHT